MGPTEPPGGWRETNRAMWDERVPIHADSTFYDLDAVRRGTDVLRGFEGDEVGDVRGKRLVHLQCHIGSDTVCWARRGATVTGVDFSGPALDVARDLAGGLGVTDARFVQADLYDAPGALNGASFDIVYTGLGALVWLPDLTTWAKVVTDLLAPGGFVYLVEFHPWSLCLGEGGRTVVRDYFERGPIVVDEPGTYADPAAATVHNVSYEWLHTMGDVISAMAQAGLRVEFVHEHEITLFRFTEEMISGPDTSGTSGGGGTVYRLPPDRPRVPLLYSLRARRD